MRAAMHISWEYPPFVVGGLSYELKGLLPKLAKRMKITLVTRGERDEVEDRDGMRTYRFASSVRSAPHILAYIHALNIDLVRGASAAIHDSGDLPIVHTHDWVSSLAGAYIKAAFGTQLVTSVYTTELTRGGALKSLLGMGIFDVEKRCFERSDLVVVKTQEMRDHLIRNYSVSGNKIAVAREVEDLLECYRGLSS